MTRDAQSREATGATIRVRANGDDLELATGTTLASWLESMGREPSTVAIERNGAIVRRPDYAATRLADGDQLELVHFVQGG